MEEDNDNLLNNNLICRICLETDSEENLIYPCKCSGNSKYIHKQCLNEWRNINHNPENFYRCEVCKYNYKIKKSISKCDLFCISLKKLSICFLFLNLVFTYLLSLFIINFLDKPENLCKLFINESCGSLYLFISALIINLLFFIYLLIYFLSIKNKHLYCKLFLEEIKNILMGFFVVILLFFLFDALFCFFILELVLLYIIHFHIGIIDKLNADNKMLIENYNSEESLLEELELEDIELEEIN
jgi:hypothetical protein